jgi:hypothetical protein
VAGEAVDFVARRTRSSSDFRHLSVFALSVSKQSVDRRQQTHCISLIWAIFFVVGPCSLADDNRTHPARPAELLVAISQADKILVSDSTPSLYRDGTSAPATALYSSTQRKDISELQDSFVFQPTSGWLRCACFPPIEITLSKGGQELGVVWVFDDLTIGFSDWSGDVRLADPDRFLRWFDHRGITGPRRGFERIRAMENADRDAANHWLDAMPPMLRPFWAEVKKDPEWWGIPPTAVENSVRVLEPQLEKEFPDAKERVIRLFSWFGSGAGPWSGFPAYEDVAAHLLLQQQQADLVAALQVGVPTDSELEGAARFFSGYCSGHLFCPPEDNKLAPLLPDELKQLLLQHVLNDGDDDKIARIQRAFGQKQR